jgi:2-oxoisovalerate dehydrogenase E2 component (dihydrolipoyl transacylase)
VAHSVFKLPDIGEGVVEGEIVAWHVQPGDAVSEDQPLVDVMTDKATVTIPSGVDGRVLATHGAVGEMVAVGSELLVLETDGEAVQEPVAVAATEQNGPTLPPLGGPPQARARNREKPLASPAVRRRAREKGVELEQITGTGRGGRITDADIEAFLTASSGRRSRMKRTGKTEVHIAGLRRRIAEKMTVSAQHIPHFSYIEQVDITELAALRHHLNNSRDADEPKLTYLPFIMLAVAKAFQKHPESNAHYDDQRGVVTRFEAAHLGVATQTERGLYVPVIRHVEAMDLWEAARELRRITQAVHHNTISREELSGSTFTITSLGVLGGLAATPIINHPEVAILGVHKAYDRPVVVDGQIVIRHMVNLSASFDHRVVDGYDGADFIQSLKDLMEHPATIFL